MISRELTPYTAHWRNQKAMYSLTGQICLNCDAKIYPPRPTCQECGSTSLKPFQFSGRGEVFSFSRVFHAPESHVEQVPYANALVKLSEGPLVTTSLTDIDYPDIRIGLPVEMVIRVLTTQGDRDRIKYGQKFRPLLID